MTAFSVNLSGSKIRQMTAEEIQQNLIEAAAEQIDKKDGSMLMTFLDPDFGIKTLVSWADNKFGIKLNINQLKDLKPQQIYEKLCQEVQALYARREIEYPVEFALSMTYRADGINIYAFEKLAGWVNDRFGAQISVSHLQNTPPAAVHRELLKISEDYHAVGLENQIDEKIASSSAEQVAEWANKRFKANLQCDDFASEPRLPARHSLGEVGSGSGMTTLKEKLLEVGRDFLRTELSELEKYVLLQLYDSAWKDHLYSMDHMKESIFMRAYAEKDPKIEYKQEGFRMFNEMLDLIEDKVTDTIFKVRLEAGARTRSVWQAGQTKHEEVSQFEMAERQRAAAQAPQGEAARVKQIKLDQPKVGRNDPCPCGSGKKYKKCCGKNT
ncbi:MAG: hypothetical protein CVV39_06535 [Planctomycetes bacterium HGW-Planctomycetes-1]|nr:MAG: hypothetical protein CVV39_06535 [Planctomycetes bacterium HGW-Planctomycetes-1]